ncbi:sulfatase [Lujinxingia vulgaris]|uniref:Sulfatase n=1 Tax=Lujinxingia vulgaris TaxID=2600176 RepID=A0A5C6XC97_9DELT|nr:sulfatase [Lujinxingia vulgaris]TXD37337.1 sulfatase [Lujinxingia vulgaris]
MSSSPPTFWRDLPLWSVGALIAGALGATLDTALTLFSASDPSLLAALFTFVSAIALWSIGAGLWAPLSAAALWAATGRPTATGLLEQTRRLTMRLWRERATASDHRRAATLMSALVALPLFAAASIAITAALIEHRNGPLLIAAASLAAQLLVIAALGVGAAALRRLLIFTLTRWPAAGRVFNTATLILATLIAGLGVALAASWSLRHTLMSIEGPTIVLIGLSLLLHPLIAFTLRGRRPGRLAGALALAAPLLAIPIAGIASQHPEARRMLVFHAETSRFALDLSQRYLMLDRIFLGGDCPVPDLLTKDELQAHIETCLDPEFDRPTARQDIPEVERPQLAQRPSFVLITWDSVRAERLGFLGGERPTSPNLDAFAKESAVFSRAFSQDSGTGPSLWSLFSGKTPFQVDLSEGHRFPPLIAPDEPLLTEVLIDEGYTAEAILCATVFDSPRWTIRRGFERFDNVCGKRKHRLAPHVTREGQKTLRRLAEQDAPFFVWLHYYDPHTPYFDHPDVDWGDEPVDHYDEELRYTDEQMAPVLDLIKELGQERPIYTFFGADHGEAFGEHGPDPHARNLYRAVTHVPLLMHGPHIEPARFETPVALNDLYPTMLDLADIPTPQGRTMVSQAPTLLGAPPDDQRMVFQENSYSRPRRHTRAVIRGDYQFIMDLTGRTEELYNLKDDPMARQNLIGLGLIEERILRQALTRFLLTSTLPEGLED